MIGSGCSGELQACMRAMRDPLSWMERAGPSGCCDRSLLKSVKTFCDGRPPWGAMDRWMVLGSVEVQVEGFQQQQDVEWIRNRKS